MKITKFVHSCILVETPDRAIIFDPGVMSVDALSDEVISGLTRLDDIMISHAHPDHLRPELIQRLINKFPDARITTTPEGVTQLGEAGITAWDTAPEDVVFFDSPHENVKPVFPQPQQNGIHYLDTYTHPGDSHSFTETKAILALPMTAPWGGSIAAINLALKLKPKHVIPIHDWHWNDQAREMAYKQFETLLYDQGITFHSLQTGQPVDIEP